MQDHYILRKKRVAQQGDRFKTNRTTLQTISRATFHAVIQNTPLYWLINNE